MVMAKDIKKNTKEKEILGSIYCDLKNLNLGVRNFIKMKYGKEKKTPTEWQKVLKADRAID